MNVPSSGPVKLVSAGRKPPPFDGEIPRGIDLINHVARCLAMGCDPVEVRKQLTTIGFTEASAEKFVADAAAWMRKNTDAGKPAGAATEDRVNNINKMVIGATLFFVGIAISVGTFYVASRGGGIYVVASGAVAFGATQFLRGAIPFFRGPAQPGREQAPGQNQRGWTG
jgi:hypothetical protein